MTTERTFKTPAKHRLTWRRWYDRVKKFRLERGQTCHGAKRKNKTGDKPGHERLSKIIDEIAELLNEAYPQLSFGLKTRSNILGRKLAAVKRHAPRMQVKVV